MLDEAALPGPRLHDGVLPCGLRVLVAQDESLPVAAVVLARAVGADGLLLLTDVDAVYRGWGSDRQERIDRLTPDAALAGLAGGAWPAGSMGPKVRACAEFVSSGGRFAAIGRLEDAAALAWGRAGTRFGSGRLGLPPYASPEGAGPG